ncbi:unnamed protein product [Ectocarpus fasciculatus]
MCGILLCIYNKCAYITGGILFAVAAVFDILVLLEWISIYNHLQDLADSDDYYSYYSDDDYENWEEWSNAILWFCLPPLLGAITLGLGAVFSFTSLCFWKDAASPAAAMSVATAHVPAPQHTVNSTYQPQNEQHYQQRYHHQQYKAAVPQQAPPPASERPPPPGYYQ